MINKKAQSQIITTVLIILLVLAAIVIVWQVVNSTITGGAESIEGVDNCFNVALEITDATVEKTATANDGSISIKRGAGAGNLKKIAVVIAGTRLSPDTDATDLGELGSTTVSSLDLRAGNSIEIYAIVGDNDRLCDAPADTLTA